MVRSPLTLEISVASKRSFHRTAAMPSRSGRMTRVGSKAIASSRKRTERPFHCGMLTLRGMRLAASLDIPCSALAVDRLAGYAEAAGGLLAIAAGRSEEQTSELQALMRNSYAVFCLKT